MYINVSHGRLRLGAYGNLKLSSTSEYCSSHNYIHSVLSLTTDGNSEDWRDLEGLLENIMLQESGNCGKSGYAHACIVEF